VVRLFEDFVEEWMKSKLADLIPNMLYSVLKTEGDILVELLEYDRAIKAYKVLKDLCE
jgi:hypothetical protein